MEEWLARTLVTVQVASYAVTAVSQPPSHWRQASDQARASVLQVLVVDQSGGVIIGANVRIQASVGSAPVERRTGRDGRATFEGLTPGRLTLRVQATGFSTASRELEVRRGEQHQRIELTVAPVSEHLAVSPLDHLRTGLVTVLTPDQIALLPDDPVLMEEVLRQMAGPGEVRFRVDGFTGVPLPNKSEIQSIRFHRDEFAAENHARGSVYVDIATKPGGGRLRGGLATVFQDESLNARDPFAAAKAPEQHRQGDLQIGGPLWRGHTSFAATISATDAYVSVPIVASLDTGDLRTQVRRPTDSLTGTLRVRQTWLNTHVLNAFLQRGTTTSSNVGVGGYNLPDRGYTSLTTTRAAYLGESGPLGSHLFAEGRLQVQWNNLDRTAQSRAATVRVLDAFESGGAGIDGGRASRALELAYNVDVPLTSRQVLRTGVQVDSTRLAATERQNGNGTFVFGSLGDYTAGLPTTFTERVGVPDVSASQRQSAWYVETEARLSESFVVSAGLRHEFQQHVSRRLNLAPRFSATWAPTSNRATTVHGGVGIFHDWLDAGTFLQAVRQDGRHEWDTVVVRPGYPDPFAGATATVLAPSVIRLSPGLALPGYVRSMVRLDQKLTKSVLLSASYFEERGHSLFRARNVNTPSPGGVRPEPAFGNIIQLEATARSAARALTVSSTLPSGRLGSASVTYTLGRAWTSTDGPFRLPVDNADPEAEFGPAPNDARHRIATYLVVAPWRGLRLNLRTTANSPLPYSITTGFDDNNDTVSNDRPVGVGPRSARGTWYLTTNALVTWQFGFGPRVKGVLPVGTAVGDQLSLSLSAPGTTRRLTVIVYADAQNVFNRINYSTFSGVLSSPFFGQPTAAFPSRQIRLGAQLLF